MSVAPKAIQTIYSRPNDHSMRPVLQLLSVSTLAGQPGRYKIILSDGEHYTTGLLSSQLITKLAGCPFKQFQLVAMDEYLVNAVQEKVFLLIHAMTEVSPPLPSGQIGNPQVYRPAPGSMPTPMAPVQQPQTVPTPQQPAPVNPYSAQPSPFQAQPSGFVNPYQQQAPQQPAPYANPYANPPAQRGMPSHSPFAAGMAHSTNQPPQQAFSGQTAGPVRYLQPSEVITPMSQLTIYTQKWTIKARVSNKSEMRTFRNAKGEGQLMTVDIVDNQQTEMRSTFFGLAAQKFHPILQIGKVYTFSKGSVKPANPRYNPKAQYELMFDDHSEIVQVQDDSNIPAMKISLISISSLAEVPVGETVDVAGIVTAVGELGSVTIKATGRDTSRRNVTLADESGCTVDLTLWGEKAERVGDEIKAHHNQSVVLFVKGCRIGDYNGRTLSTSGSSLVEIDPNHPKCAQLKSWWAQQGNSTSFASLSTSGGGGPSAGGGNKRVTIQAMRSEDVGSLVVGGRAMNSHLVKATVIHIPVRDAAPLYYKSCLSEVDDGRGGRRQCQKKAELQGDVYVCAEQHANRTANSRFILSMRIQDPSGECLVRAFHDQAKSVLGVDSLDIDGAPDPVAAQQMAVEAALFKPYVFRIRSKKEIHMDEEKINMVVADAAPVVPAVDAAYMLGNIKQYLTRIGA